MDQKNYYENYWIEGGQHLSEYMEFKQTIVKDIDTENSLIFDYGGGNGQVFEYVKNRNHIVIGDISEAALKNAQEKGFNTVIIKDDFNFKNLINYDYILLLDCLEHMIDPEYIFKNIVLNLKDDVKIYISVPNMLNIFSRIFFIFGNYIDFCDKSHLTKELFSDHIHLFSKDKLEKLLDKYRVVPIKKYFFMPKEVEMSKNLSIKIIWKILYKLKLYNYLPSLFSLCFFYECEKR